jgi:hypothetical protein
MTIKTLDKWEEDEPALAPKQNEIHRQLKKFGAVPITVGLTIALAATNNDLNNATGNTFGSRKFGRGTYGA